MPSSTLRRCRQLPLSWALGGVLLFALGWLAWRPRSSSVHVFDVRARPEWWHDSGFIEMVPPLRLPGRAGRGLETSVWLRLPTHGLLRVSQENGRPMLSYPEGTEAVRVEVWQPNGAIASQVADVRGVRFTSPDTQQFFVLKPRDAHDPGALRGFSWPRSDLAAGTRATALLAEFAAKNLPKRQALQAAAVVAAQNACTSCHTLARPDALSVSDRGAVRRGTDGAGLFQVQSVLSDHVPLESYAPREQNLDDPAIQVRCGDLPAQRVAGKFGLVFQCADGVVPVGYLNVERALAAGDARVARLCRARRYLHEHLTPAGRAAFSAAFRACGI